VGSCHGVGGIVVSTSFCCSISVSENMVLPVLKEKKMVHWATFISSQSSHMYMFLLQITILDQHDHITNSGFWNKNSLLFTCTERKGSLLVLVGAYPHSLKGLYGLACPMETDHRQTKTC
jgi:hypothetical protein